MRTVNRLVHAVAFAVVSGGFLYGLAALVAASILSVSGGTSEFGIALFDHLKAIYAVGIAAGVVVGTLARLGDAERTSLVQGTRIFAGLGIVGAIVALVLLALGRVIMASTGTVASNPTTAFGQTVAIVLIFGAIVWLGATRRNARATSG
jgi:hypothetical protein